MRRSLAFGVVVVAAAGSPVAHAGPPERRPLRAFADPSRPQPAADGPGLSYVEGGKPVLLYDTGVAVVKGKGGRSVEGPEVKRLLLPTGDELRDLQARFERAGATLVNLDETKDGARALLRRDDVEWVLPVVVPAGARSGGEPTRLAMTPRIVADLVKREEGLALARSVGLVEMPSDLRGGLVYLRLADGPVRHDRLLEAANRLAVAGREAGTVASAKPDFVPVKRREQDPKDPRWPQQWHLHATTPTATAHVDVSTAWAVTLGVPTVRIAVIDDSVQPNHPDLRANFQKGRYYDGYFGVTEPSPEPRRGEERHGTACAGVAVGAANDLGGRGAAPGCGLIGIHFWDASIAQTADAFRFAADPDGDPSTDDGAHVISCSWSWNPSFEEVRKAIAEVATRGRPGAGDAPAKGIPVLFAAGNDFGEVEAYQWFGTLPDVICVAASNWEDDHSAYSNRGRTVSVCAPSSDSEEGRPRVETTDNTDDLPRYDPDYAGYARGDYTGAGASGFGGTSSSTPLVAGICGLMLAANPDLTAAQVRSILEHTAKRVPGTNTPARYHPVTSHDVRYGHGRVDAGKAVEAAAAAKGAREAIWPEPAREVAVEASSNGVRVSWKRPVSGADRALVVRLGTVGWHPEDGVEYTAGQDLPGGGKVVAVTDASEVEVASASADAVFAVFTASAARRYGWGALPERGPEEPRRPASADARPRPAEDRPGK